MKQKIFAFTILFICAVFIYPFCVTAETNLNQQRVQQSTTQKVVTKPFKPQATNTNVKNTNVKNTNVKNTNVKNTNVMYVVKFKIHQTTYSLSLGEYIKNRMNDLEFEIPVDKVYYDKCKVGDLINDPKLKIGSLIMDGDFSQLKIYISGKSIKKR